MYLETIVTIEMVINKTILMSCFSKYLQILRPDGIIVGQFAFHLNHPVGACQAPGGEILITDWGSGR